MPGKPISILAACGAAVAAWLAFAAPAPASSDMETVIQDDSEIVYQDDPAKLDRTLGTIKALGIDTIRVSLYWHLVAPNPKSRRKPDFGENGPTYPGSYPESRWLRYDRIVKLAAKNGLNVYFSITGPAPRWAADRSRRDINNVRPNPRYFREFVTAVGGRYSGFYPDPSESGSSDSPDSGTTTPTLPPLPVSTGSSSRARVNLPRVSRWSIWNEPNFPSWLLPQWKRLGRRSYRALSPVIYRRLVDAAWSGLTKTTHGGDVILLGETAPYGPKNRRSPGVRGLMSPPQFVRELYCLDGRNRPFRGNAARARACPTTAASRRRFRATHPGLFEATGWAHHGYSLQKPPTYRGVHNDAAPLGAVSRLTRSLDRAQDRWGGEGGWPVWLTEYGYQTMPPDPFRGVPWKRQAAWMSWAEYLAYGNPRVDSFAQFLLVDSAPRLRYAPSDSRRWVTWQSGFVTTDGEVKPGFREFQHPIHVTPARAADGRSARVFGLFRTALYDTPLQARIEFAEPGGDWETLESLTVTNARGYLLRRVTPPGTGKIRIVWTDPSDGSEVATRAQEVIRR